MTLKARYQSDKIKRDAFIKQCNPRSFDFQIATWFGSGLIIPAPGTWGTLGGIIFSTILYFFTNPFILFLASIILFWVGLQSVKRIEEKLDNHDPSFIVIDEVAAIVFIMSLDFWLIDWLWDNAIRGDIPAVILFISFLLFRFYDAKKPWLIGIADRKIKGAWGVMIDDLIAAIFTIITALITFLVLYILAMFNMH